MGLLSLISRLGKADCVAPCQPIECGFVCETCFDQSFRVRVTFQGIQNTFNCNTCGLLNGSFTHTGSPFGDCSGCSEVFRFFAPVSACGGLSVLDGIISQNLIRVDILGDVPNFISYRLIGPDVVAALCGGGSVVVPFHSEGGLIQYCNSSNSTCVLEVIPAGPCTPGCTPPTITLTTAPPLETISADAEFGWTTTGTVDATVYRLDGGLPIPVPSNPFTITLETPQIHTMEIEVQSPCGNASVSHTWEQLPTPVCDPPTVAFTSTPPLTTSDTTAVFTWTTTGTVANTLLRLDGGAPTAPTSGQNVQTYHFLAPGQHTLEIEVLSGACGNSSATYTWTITDNQPCVPPTVTLTQTPPASTSSTTANFAWTTTGTVATVLIKIDDLPFTNPSGNNTHSFTNLAPGFHTVEVKVEAPCGTHSAFFTWEVTAPCTPPTVTFTQTPPNPTTSTTAVFVWGTTGSVTQTTIRIDGGTPQPPNGTNAHTFNNLATGSHTVEVFVGGPCGTDTDTYTWQITPATTLCEKVNSLFQLIGTAEPNVDVEITFSGVFANNCGLTNYNRTYLIPGPHVPINNCPDVTVCETIVDTVGCGVISGTYPDGSWILCPNLNLSQINGLPTLAWLLCTGCTSPGISTPPMIRVRSSVPATGTSGDQFADFAASGTAQVTALVDQMLATGSCQIPFFSQIPANPGPTTGFPNRDFRFATCTIRIL
jgi:hypothetical protein